VPSGAEVTVRLNKKQGSWKKWMVGWVTRREEAKDL
jgi:hypothetical protein